MTARKPFDFPRDTSDPDLEEVPELNESRRRHGQCIGPDDVVWMVRDGEGRLRTPLPKLGYERYSPFDLVLLAIIRAHPKEGGKAPDESEYGRLRQARTALFGEPGLDLGLSRADDEILLRVARQVFEDIFAGKGGEVELAPLIRRFAAPHYKPEELVRTEQYENSIVRRLITHFEKHRDEYLTRVTTPDYYARARIDRTIDEIFDRLELLGVSVDRKAEPRT